MAKGDEGNPWLQIWVEPRATIRSIVKTNPRYGYLLLCILYGLPMALSASQNFSLVEKIPLWAIWVGSLVVCLFLGMIGIGVTSWLLHWTGKWIGGKGNYQTIRAAVAWATVPNSVTILMWVLLTGVFGGLVFDRHFAEMTYIGYQAGVVFIVFLMQTIVSIWGFIILLKALGEVQGFSAWKALLNVLIPVVIVTVITWVVGWVLSGFGLTA
ncbi:MAG: YIP1 family protein [Verrucomicrobia bacterium]|nr:YIP1 family protein [Verrucomicrobiota bacterium]